MDKKQVMLVTGTNQGIGKAIVKYFASRGVKIIMTYHTKKNEVQVFKKELKEKYHASIDTYYLDLKDEESVKKLYESVKEKDGKINYLVNNAAISQDSYLFDKTKSEFMEVLEVNVVGTFLMMKYFDEIVNGYIFNMSSTDGIDTGSLYSIDYNISKEAINTLTKDFSLVSKNRIISLCPNWVDTESTRSMDKDYLKKELERINQKELISVDTIPKVIRECIVNHTPTGSIIRIEGDNNYGRIN